ncbi:MAG: flavodoxin [Bacteroides sp.]|nr:flavodoxin [Bacteroides sp.]MCM1457970.1 flavodoxin [Lachnoclostridium sp.]
MRKIISMAVMLVASALSMVSCANNNAETTANETNNTKDNNMSTSISDKKTLVAFFSHTGENYGVGNISEGNTHIIAKMIGEATGGSLFEIVPEKDYPHDSYDAVVEIAKQEKEQKARPAIKGDVKAEDYDVVFIGYPNWWGDMPMPVYTFLEKHDWTGKVVVPFCTHEGSGLSSTEEHVAEACKGATVAKGLAVRGETAQNNREQARKSVNSWIEKLK